ncbi:MAG: hypothetical protein HF973_00180 [Chloroflexi bacterium]|nr:hypothetical protein [Chloroflexota bacterium]
MDTAAIAFTFLRILAFILGVLIVLSAIVTAVKTFVVPRGVQDPLARLLFRSTRAIFRLLAHGKDYDRQDRIMAFYAPVTLLLLPVVLLVVVQIGYMFLYWAVEPRPFFDLFELSGSSLLTLGSAERETYISKILEFSEATIGLILIALLIAYLPTMYAAFSRRETAVALWDGRAGTPPTVAMMINRTWRTGELTDMGEIWLAWQIWFSELEESHTSLASLAFFRSPRPGRSWITAAGNVLDSAAFMLAAVDIPFDPKAAFCLRSGFLALRHIADYFSIPYDPDPDPNAPISISRYEFDQVWEEMAQDGVPLKADKEQAWRDFQGWRVNYDAVLLQIASLIMAPYAPWISDRSAVGQSGKVAK